MTRVALLSHRSGNVGHSFMAVGFESVVRQAFGQDVDIVHYEQHRPFSVFPEGHFLRRVDDIPYGRLPWLKRLAASRAMFELVRDQFAPIDARVAIACGGPNIVAGAGRTTEMRLIFHLLNGAFHAREVPVIDAAVGACYPAERLPERIDDPVDVAFYRRLFELCARSTVRDRLAARLWQQLGRHVDVIPCAASVSGRELLRLGGARRDEYVLINFQERGANEDWGQNVDKDAWLTTVRRLVERLQLRHRVVFLCHDNKEYRLATQNFPGLSVTLPRDFAEYARTAMGAKALLASRVHAVIPLAGAGIGGVHVGTDSRMGTIAEFGLTSIYVKQATADGLEDSLERQIADRDSERERLIALREQTALSYTRVISETVERRA